jgi:hypothetical protein
MSQTDIIFAVILLAFLIFVTMNGDLGGNSSGGPTWLGIFGL